MEKVCIGCKEPKHFDHFTKRKNGTPQSYCKPCHNEYCRKDYLNNKIEHNKARYSRKKIKIKEIKEIVRSIKCSPCSDCKVSHPHWRLEFDHARGVKKYDISNAARVNSRSVLRQELAKCDLVCANCHKDRTYLRSIGEWPSGKASSLGLEDRGSDSLFSDSILECRKIKT
jgi:hypothetical protein